MRNLFFVFFALLAFVSCSKSDPTTGGATGTVEVAAEYLKTMAVKEKSEMSIPIVTELSKTEWTATSNVSWCVVYQFDASLLIKLEKNSGTIARVATITIEGGTSSFDITVVQASESAGAGDVASSVVEYLFPTSGVASQAYSQNNDIDKTFNNSTGGGSSSVYLSAFPSQTTNFPITLEYFFDESQTDMIDRITYCPFADYGSFGEVDIYVKAVGDADYTLATSTNFYMNESSTTVGLSEAVRPAAVKFVISSGESNCVSCDEMYFVKTKEYSSDEEMLLEVFTDLSCTELKSGVVESDLEVLPDFYKAIAFDILLGLYDTKRIVDYSAHSDCEKWATLLLTNRYTRLNNPMGINVAYGDEVVVFVGETHGNAISIDITNSDMEYNPYAGTSYPLFEGVNKFTALNKGMMFLNYTVSDINAASAKDITVHVAKGSGVADGFYDREKMDDDTVYADLIKNATGDHFAIKGENLILVYHTEQLKEYAPNVINEVVDICDDIAASQHKLMGIEDIRGAQMNNRILAFSFDSSDDGYLWAKDYRLGFIKTKLEDYLSKDRIMISEDNTWGLAHEIGHIHQGAFEMEGSIESSNNLFSNFTRQEVGIYCSRGSEIWQLADRRVKNLPWCDLLGVRVDGTNSEDEELHMRLFWQLWVYFHKCEVMADFWPKLFTELRANPIDRDDIGNAQLQFAKAVCKVSNSDMTDFFEAWGFFEECNIYVRQYDASVGQWCTVTEDMVNDTKSYMSQFSKAAPIEYIEDRLSGDKGAESYVIGDVGYYTTYKENKKITGTVSYTLSGNDVTVSGGSNAVAYEIYQGEELLYFFNSNSHTIPSAVSVTGATFKAVQADGERITMTQN